MKEALLDQALLKEVALQVVQQGILKNWLFYAVLLALSLLSGAAGAYLSKYFGKRGETAATKADFEEILRQLKETTELTEQVRKQVDHADWVAREWKTIRRVKLEELLQSAFTVEHWMDQQSSRWMNFHNEQYEDKGKERNIQSPVDQVVILSDLYFPELEAQSTALFIASGNAIQWLVNKAIEIQKDHLTTEDKGNRWLSISPDWKKQWDSVIHAIAELRDEASKIMRKEREK